MPTENIFYKFIASGAVFLYVFFAPAFYWIAAVGFFIAADLIIRLLVCKRHSIPIESEKMWRTVYKFGFGLMFIMVAHVFQKIFNTDIPIMKIIASYLILVELRSIDEKAQEITGNSMFSIVIEKFSLKQEKGDKKRKEVETKTENEAKNHGR